jgi:DNA topoisomerase-1
MSDDHVRPAGYRREPTGQAEPRFLYRDSSGALVEDPATLARFRALAVPPAWDHVWIAPQPADKVQVVGVDRAGRTQYRYSPEWTALRSTDKFGHVHDFAVALPAIRSHVRTGLGRAARAGAAAMTRDRVLALTVRLLDLGFFRVGSERYAHDNDTYGLTTLQRHHVRVEGGVVHFDYTAKEHLHRVIEVADPVAARYAGLLVDRDDDGAEFLAWRRSTGDWQPVHSSHVNAYLHANSGIDATAKQFRTWAGTVLAASVLGGARHGEAARSPVLAAVRATSRLLGNTPAVARAAYIHPDVLRAFEQGDTIAPAVTAAAEALGDDRLTVIWREPSVQAAVADLLVPERLGTDPRNASAAG